MKKEPKKEVVWPIRMTQEFKDKFKTFCDENGYSMNKKIKILIVGDGESKNDIQKKAEELNLSFTENKSESKKYLYTKKHNEIVTTTKKIQNNTIKKLFKLKKLCIS